MLPVCLWEPRAGVAWWALATSALVAMLTMLSAGTSVAHAEACPNEQVRQQEIYASQLPDCRAYEQVSPVAKNLTDALGKPGTVQAAPSGDGVSFFAVAPFPGAAGSAGQAPTYLSTRSSGDEWLTKGLLPVADPGSADRVLGLTEDLTETILSAEEPPLAPGAATGSEARNAYLFNNTTGLYQLLAPDIGTNAFSFTDATPGNTRILFETDAQLTANAAPGAYNLYEWREDEPLGRRITLAGVLQDEEAPEGGSVAGPGGPAVESLGSEGSASEFYTQNTISEDGTRIFFTEEAQAGKGIIYMREPKAKRTVQVSAGIKPAYWRAATPSGAFVFYTEDEGLYRYSTEREQRQALTSSAAGVLGTLGISDEGSYVYFVATGKLASNINGRGEEAETGAANLYEWHESSMSQGATPVFIAKLLGFRAGEVRDEADWRGYSETRSEGGGPAGGEKSSRVTSDGKSVLFSSVAQLTGYDNNGQVELYLYDAELPLSPSNPVCVSCNPSGMPAASGAHLGEANGALVSFPPSRNAFLTRNLSEDGSRVFFQTAESLVPEDKNNQTDVYEWERAGTGSCEDASTGFSVLNGGCIYLISTGQSDEPSYFGDASANGDNVFFFTRQSLVGQDRDLNVDLYDARVDGGIAAQNPPPPPTPCAGETCREASPPPPVFDPPSSATITGAGNLQVEPAHTTVEPKPTRAQRLAKALRACRKPAKRLTSSERRACEARARRRYGTRSEKKRVHSRKSPVHSTVRRRGP
jgi:hypothetical protein